jgi:hypothetical protein
LSTSIDRWIIAATCKIPRAHGKERQGSSEKLRA